jgi:hypothetical protein
MHYDNYAFSTAVFQPNSHFGTAEIPCIMSIMHFHLMRYENIDCSCQSSAPHEWLLHAEAYADTEIFDSGTKSIVLEQSNLLRKLLVFLLAFRYSVQVRDRGSRRV